MDDSQAADLAEAIVDPVRLVLSEIVEGATEDVQRFAASISSDLVAAAARGDEAAVAEVQAQARTLAEVNRLRLVRGQWDAVERVVGSLANVLLSSVRVLG